MNTLHDEPDIACGTSGEQEHSKTDNAFKFWITVYSAKKRSTHAYILEIWVRYADGTVKKKRRSYPTLQIADSAKANLSERHQHIVDCISSGVMWTDSQDVQDAVTDVRSARKQKSRDEAAVRKAELTRKRSEERAKRRKQISAIRQRSPRKHKKERTPEEIEADTRRGLEAKARFEERQRERQLSASERQTQIRRCRELTAQRAVERKLQKQAEIKRRRSAELQKRNAIKQQILEVARIERSQRLQYEADRRAGKLVFDGADALLKFCTIGLLTDEQAQLLVRIDVDPDIVIRSLKSIASLQEVERQASVAHLVETLQDHFGKIPEREHITRWSIRAASELCMKETQELTTDNISQSLFFSFENEEDDTAWLEQESDFELANSNVSGQSITEKKVPSTGVAA